MSNEPYYDSYIDAFLESDEDRFAKYRSDIRKLMAEKVLNRTIAEADSLLRHIREVDRLIKYGQIHGDTETARNLLYLIEDILTGIVKKNNLDIAELHATPEKFLIPVEYGTGNIVDKIRRGMTPIEKR